MGKTDNDVSKQINPVEIKAKLPKKLIKVQIEISPEHLFSAEVPESSKISDAIKQAGINYKPSNTKLMIDNEYVEHDMEVLDGNVIIMELIPEYRPNLTFGMDLVTNWATAANTIIADTYLYPPPPLEPQETIHGIIPQEPMTPDERVRREILRGRPNRPGPYITDDNEDIDAY